MPSAPWKPYGSTFLGEISSISFDPYTDLLWTANPSGTVVSHFLPSSTLPNTQDGSISRYTSFKSHSYRSQSTELLIAERGVFSLGDKSLKFTNRRGLPHWFLSTAFQDARSMAFTTPKSVELLIGGAQAELVLINANNGTVIRKLNLNDRSSPTINSPPPPTKFSPITHLKKSQSLMCCGSRSGTVSLRDPTTLKEEHSMMAHYAGLEQMEIEGNYLVTCGYSLKQGHPVRDPLVKVFDVRALRPLAPITFSSSPAHVRFHPRMSSTLFITSSTGQLQITDLAHPLPSSSFYQLDVGTFITDMCISSSGDGIAYTEADGVVHLWTTAGAMEMNLGDEDVRGAGKFIKWSRGNLPISLPDPVEAPTSIQWNDETPLSSIGMPYYSTELFSVLPPETYITAYSPLYQHKPLPDSDLALAIHQRPPHHQLCNTLHEAFDAGGPKFDKVQYFTNSRKTKRYQASLPILPTVSFSGRAAIARVGSPSHHLGQLASNSKRKLSIPLFRSEREKEKAKSLHRGLKATKDTIVTVDEADKDDEISFDLSIEDFEEMPRWYRQVEIKYSKFGIEDFDFGFYNNTQYSGLETHIVNSYTNSLLQMLYHTLPVRQVAESHIALACTTPNCMLCELGFLFKMLDDAQGVNCQTSNFSRSFSINQRAIALELMDHQHQEFCLHQSQIIPRLLNHNDSSSSTNSATTNNPGSQQPKIPISSKSYSSLIQLCHHFLLDQISEDASKVLANHDHHQYDSLRLNPINTQVKTTKSSTSVATISNHLLPSPIADIYTMRWKTNQTCPSCHHQTSRTTFTKVIEMSYPRKALSNEPKPNTDFCSILKNSMIRDTVAKSLCSNCNQYTHQRWRREPDDQGLGNRSLPSVLAINAGVTNSEQFEIWLDERAKSSSGTNPIPPTQSTHQQHSTMPCTSSIATSTTTNSNEPTNSNSTAGNLKPIAATTHISLPEDGYGSNYHQHFLQPEIGISIESNPNRDGNSTTTQSQILIGDNHPIKVPDGSVKYELRGLIVQIQSDDETPHLVSLIKVHHLNLHSNSNSNSTQSSDLSSNLNHQSNQNSNHHHHDHPCQQQPPQEDGGAGSSWYLFNDFLVRKISQEEALSFPACWKVPCILYYVRADLESVLDLSRLPRNEIDKSILLKDINLSKCRDVNKIRHQVLAPNELPKKGDLVAIDAEFVSLQQEEVDYKSDGTRLVRRPSQMTLARVSVLRGEGIRTGVPFIDDHIQTFEPITDYLTEYSGIRPGDLDLNASPHTLVPLKVAYKKLRLLVDLGCIFIGHGLSKDFRIINIHVPPSQIIDTVDLYYIPSRQRKLSLRLLSYLILKHDIQNAGTHDSIEDARTALQLYDIYRQLNNEGVWKEELESVYRKGKEMGWKVPADKSRSPLPAPAVPPTFPSSTTRDKLTKSPSVAVSSPLNPNASPVQVRRFTPSTLSATSASYFPSNSSPGNVYPSNSRPIQSLIQNSKPVSTSGESINITLDATAPLYRPVSRTLQPKVSPPTSNFGNNNSNHSLIGTIQTGAALHNNSKIQTNSTTTPVFQRFTTAPPPVFEPKKKLAAGFNPMAPSFVHSSSANRSLINTGASSSGYHHHSNNSNNEDNKPHPNHHSNNLLNNHSNLTSGYNGNPLVSTNESSSTIESYPNHPHLPTQHHHHYHPSHHPGRVNINNDAYNFHLNPTYHSTPTTTTTVSSSSIPPSTASNGLTNSHVYHHHHHHQSQQQPQVHHHHPHPHHPHHHSGGMNNTNHFNSPHSQITTNDYYYHPNHRPPPPSTTSTTSSTSATTPVIHSHLSHHLGPENFSNHRSTTNTPSSSSILNYPTHPTTTTAATATTTCPEF